VSQFGVNTNFIYGTQYDVVLGRNYGCNLLQSRASPYGHYAHWDGFKWLISHPCHWQRHIMHYNPLPAAASRYAWSIHYNPNRVFPTFQNHAAIEPARYRPTCIPQCLRCRLSSCSTALSSNLNKCSIIQIPQLSSVLLENSGRTGLARVVH
jgi:hypothetical protein